MPKRRRRYIRRGGLGRSVVAARRQRRLTIGLTVVVVVVAGFAAIVIDQIPRAEKPYQSSLDSSFAASVGPIADESNYTGSELSSMITKPGSHLDVGTFVATLDSMVGDANQTVDQFETLPDPGTIAAATSSCLQSLRARAGALATLKQAIANVLGSIQSTGASTVGTSGATEAESTIEGLDSTLSYSDERWANCRAELLKAPGNRSNLLPRSSWVGSPSVWSQTNVVGFVNALISAETSADAGVTGPVSIVAVSISPPPEVTIGGFDYVPVTGQVDLHVVVKNAGAMAERQIQIKVTLDPVGNGTGSFSQATTDLGPGQSVSLHPSALTVTSGDKYSLTVTATGPGMSQPANRTYRIAVESANGVTS